MIDPIFPPDPTLKTGFYPIEVYRKCLEEYPSINELVKKKSVEYGDKLFIATPGGRKYTYKQVHSISGEIAMGLSKIGVKKGDHVAIFAYNSPEWILSYLGILKAGSVPVTVNTSFIGDPLIYNLKMTDTKYLFLDNRLVNNYKNIENNLEDLLEVIIIGNNNQEIKKKNITYENLISKANNETLFTDLKLNDPAAIILTSGTTGPSKAVVEINAQFIATALDMADAGGVNSSSIVYVYLPLFHIMALDLATLSSLMMGATIILTEKFNPAIFREDIKKYNVTHFHAVGPILEALIKQSPDKLGTGDHPVIAIAYASKEVWQQAVEKLGIVITGGYGGTEAGIPVTSPYDLVIKRANPAGSCGKAAPPFEVILEDSTGKLIDKGEGEILIRPKLPYVTFMEYYKMPENTLKAFRGLWFHTGDLGRIDDEGYLYFVDRLKDSIRRKGENISSYEVEQILLSSSLIKDAAVIPVAMGNGDEEVMAVIVPTSNACTPEMIIDFCVTHMPSFWIPSYLRFVSDLPKTQTGRTEKHKLRTEGITEDTVKMHEYISKKLHSLKS
ncbi:MAG: AMP-binding protein [Thermoplasmatales archaeon]